MSDNDIKAKLGKIGKTIQKAYIDTADWSNDNLSAMTDENTLMGSLHRYRMWKASFKATALLFQSSTNQDLTLTPEITPAGDVVRKDNVNMVQVLNDHFTTDQTTELQHEIEMGYWAAKAGIAKTKMQKTFALNAAIYGYGEAHKEMMTNVSNVLQAIEGLDDDLLYYNNTGLIVGIGLLLLQSPKTLSLDDINEVISDIDVRISALSRLTDILNSVPAHNDPSIDRFMNDIAGMELTDYADNILNGRVFGLGDATSHAAALVNLASMAEGVLSPCISMVLTSQINMQALNGAYGSTLEEVGKVITGMSDWITARTRDAARKAIGLALGVIGISGSAIDMLMGVKMQIKQLERDAMKAIRGLEVTGVMAKPDLGICPITALINAQNALAIYEAGLKNACLIPFMAMANTILKPIMDGLSDLEEDIKSYEEMLGESLAAAFNMISLPRWIDYVMSYQISMMRDAVSMQTRHYRRLRQEFMRLKRSIPKPKDRMKMINRVMQAYIRRLVKVSEEHDNEVAEGSKSYDKLQEGIKLLQSIISLLTARTATDSDKKDIVLSMKHYDNLIAEEQAGRRKIRDSYKNLEGLWREISEMRADDFVGETYRDFFKSFTIYSRIVKILFGVNLNELISELQKDVENLVGPLNQDPSQSASALITTSQEA